MEWWHVYLFTRLDGFNTACSFLFGLGLIATVVAVFGGLMAHDWAKTFGSESNKEYIAGFNRLVKVAPAVMVVGGLLSIAIPTQKEAAAIYLLPKLANSQFVTEAQQIPTDAAKLMRLKLEQWIADMEPAKEKK
jgi:hypothetical protein